MALCAGVTYSTLPISNLGTSTASASISTIGGKEQTMTEMINRLIGYVFGLITMYIIIRLTEREDE
jgi:hypothetical protein